MIWASDLAVFKHETMTRAGDSVVCRMPQMIRARISDYSKMAQWFGLAYKLFDLCAMQNKSPGPRSMQCMICISLIFFTTCSPEGIPSKVDPKVRYHEMHARRKLTTDILLRRMSKQSKSHLQFPFLSCSRTGTDEILSCCLWLVMM